MRSPSRAAVGLLAVGATLLAGCGTEQQVSTAAPTVTVTQKVGDFSADEPTATVTVTETVSPGDMGLSNAPAPEDDEGSTDSDVPDTTTGTAPEAGDATVSEGEIAYGETWTYEDGLAITVSKPMPFEPSETAAGAEDAEQYVMFTVRIDNGTGDSVEPGEFHATLQSGTTEAEQVFDSAKGLDGAPYSRLLDGRSIEFPIAFGATTIEDLVMQVRPDFERESAFFITD